MKYVIIGNSTAAIGCVEGIRSIDRQGEIVIISREKYHTYCRPLISYLLLGETDEQKMKYRPDDFYEKMGCETRLGMGVKQIQPKQKRVVLEDGEEIPYDKLMIATGSRPFIPPMEGLDQVPNKFTFMSLDDAKRLEQALTPQSRVLIIGAGLIGLKCAEGIHQRVKEIHVVDMADHILPSILDAEGAKIVQEHIEKQGIQFHLNTSAQKLGEKEAVLQNGERIPFDILVVAVGVRPNVELAKEAGIRVERGICIDQRCKTSEKDVYAAGDCVESHDITTDKNRILALLPNAYMQGECAGINMAGGDKVFDKAMPLNAIGFFGLHMATAGAYQGIEYADKTPDTYKKLYVEGDRLMGFIIIGKVERAGIYTSLIREKTPLSSIDFELVRQKPQLMAFSQKERKKKLGGAV